MENIKLSRPNNVCEAWWTEVCKKLKNAIVFLDNFVAESLHWSGGLERLIKAGCKDVKEFSAFEVCQDSDEKAVFLLAGLVTGATADTLRDIIKSSKLKYVIIVTGAHSSVHAYASFGGREIDERAVMNKLEEQVLEWMGNLNYTVEIFYFPLILVQPTEDSFLLPFFHDLQPVFEDDMEEYVKQFMEFSKGDRKGVESLEALEFQHLPFNLRVSIQHFMVCLHGFLQSMSAREEIYTIGHMARIVGAELESYNPARQRRRVSGNKVSLILVDRILDLVSPSEFDGTILMNRVLNLLPRLPGHMVDSAVDLSSISAVHSSCEWTLVPGCFAHPCEGMGRTILEKSINSPSRETLKVINSEVCKALGRQTEAKVNRENSSLVDQLSENVKLLFSSEDKFQNHFYLIQQSLAVIEVLKHFANTHLDQLHGVEKMLLHTLDDPLAKESPFHQVLHLLKNRERKEVKIEEVLSLFIYLVSLGGPSVIPIDSEYAFINALSQAFVEDKNKHSDVLQNIFRGEIDEVSALKIANLIWRRLRAISTARSHLKDYRILHGKASNMEPNRYQSLISKLVEDCLDPPQQPITDLDYKSVGLKDIIKTGFSLFVNVTKPRPKDAALIMVYVLGGITPTEVNEVKSTVTRLQPSCQVLIGSSHLTNPSDIVQRSFMKRF